MISGGRVILHIQVIAIIKSFNVRHSLLSKSDISGSANINDTCMDHTRMIDAISRPFFYLRLFGLAAPGPGRGGFKLCNPMLGTRAAGVSFPVPGVCRGGDGRHFCPFEELRRSSTSAVGHALYVLYLVFPSYAHALGLFLLFLGLRVKRRLVS